MNGILLIGLISMGLFFSLVGYFIGYAKGSANTIEQMTKGD